jgi:hypothetical protein
MQPGMVACNGEGRGKPVPIKSKGRTIDSVVGVNSTLAFAKKKLLKLITEFTEIVNFSRKEGFFFAAKRFSKISRSFSDIVQMVA